MNTSSKPPRLFPLLLALVLGAAFSGAHAQPGASVDPNTWLDAGQRAVQMIDQNKVGELWDGGSPEMKKQVDKKQLIASIKKARGADAVALREWQSIERSTLDAGSGAPAGLYVNLRFRAKLGSRIVTELVTFRQDADGGWRWMGYLVQ